MLQVKVRLEIKTNTRDTERGHEGRYRTHTKNAFWRKRRGLAFASLEERSWKWEKIWWIKVEGLAQGAPIS